MNKETTKLFELDLENSYIKFYFRFPERPEDLIFAKAFVYPKIRKKLSSDDYERNLEIIKTMLITPLNFHSTLTYYLVHEVFNHFPFLKKQDIEKTSLSIVLIVQDDVINLLKQIKPEEDMDVLDYKLHFDLVKFFNEKEESEVLKKQFSMYKFFEILWNFGEEHRKEFWYTFHTVFTTTRHLDEKTLMRSLIESDFQKREE